MGLNVSLDGTEVTGWGPDVEADAVFDANQPPDVSDPAGLGWTVTGSAGARVLLTPNGSVYAEETVADPSGGGAGSLPAIVGPFAFAFDTAGLDNSGPFVPLDVGTWVIAAWAVVLTTFEAAGEVQCTIQVTSDAAGGATVFQADLAAQQSYPSDYSVAAATSTIGVSPVLIQNGPNAGLWVNLDGSPTAGTGDFYALIIPVA